MTRASRLPTVTSPPTTSSAFMPSSVICTARVFGVHSEVTLRRSTPGRKNSVWVRSCRRVSAALFQISPWFARSTTMTRLAPNSTSRYWLNVLI
ncbi:hypothetical protein D3C78_1573140 [compost metagenome]